MLKVISRLFLHLFLVEITNVTRPSIVIVSKLVIVSSHKKQTRNFYSEMNSKTCSCRNKDNCPLDNKC